MRRQLLGSRLTAALDRNLRSYCEYAAVCSDVSLDDGCLVDPTVYPVEHEADVRVAIPVLADRRALQLAAEHVTMRFRIIFMTLVSSLLMMHVAIAR